MTRRLAEPATFSIGPGESELNVADTGLRRAKEWVKRIDSAMPGAGEITVKENL